MPLSTPAVAPRRSVALAALVLAAATGCGAAPAPAGSRTVQPAPVPDAAVSSAPSTDSTRAADSGTAGDTAGTPPARHGAPTGLGPAVLARIPASTSRLVVVTGKGADSYRSTAALWIRDHDGTWWRKATWPAHNGRRGWSEHHVQGDLRSPAGVFTLSDAGGRLPDPGTGLPYHRSTAFTVGGTGFLGEPLAGSFDYVVAIDYNRVPGTSPLDWTRPMGAARGGGIWLHVDHAGPTHGCVSLSKRHMAALLRALDPAAHPAVVMGDATFLAR
ncbi:L,D-transpeptidase family protein [Wenjunlia tyrosinilytica]|uniref:Lipoprotein n=1 Tax=Wenjunlia tyrosinilytica TaxID=1544741 RepID=A0A918DXZ3_9ACTN|nr:L,D-transpeptidase family protein [Wenjunlia tyrosinilytica]GGO87987.1 lipoprotein [Wenjunlia tyrosinilytica]